LKSLKAVHLCSLILTLACWGGAHALPVFSWSGAVIALSFMHFAATLILFYREEGVTRRRPWLGVALPATMLTVFSLGVFFWRDRFAGCLVAFFPLLLWHYSKQSMGLFVLSLRQAPGMSDPHSGPRQFVLAAFLLLGTFGYLNSQTASMLTQTFGFYVPSLQLPAGDWVLVMRGLSLAAVAYLTYLAIREKQYLAAATPAVFYLWMDYPLTSFALVPFLPALHAGQYLPIALERGVRGRGFFWFAVLITVATAVLFSLLRVAPRSILSVGVFVAMAELTLNIHHYFLDAHIWRVREQGNRRDLGL
jgi:hypothetical protein